MGDERVYHALKDVYVLYDEDVLAAATLQADVAAEYNEKYGYRIKKETSVYVKHFVALFYDDGFDYDYHDYVWYVSASANRLSDGSKENLTICVLTSSADVVQVAACYYISKLGIYENGSIEIGDFHGIKLFDACEPEELKAIKAESYSPKPFITEFSRNLTWEVYGLAEDLAACVFKRDHIQSPDDLTDYETELFESVNVFTTEERIKRQEGILHSCFTICECLSNTGLCVYGDLWKLYKKASGNETEQRKLLVLLTHVYGFTHELLRDLYEVIVNNDVPEIYSYEKLSSS